MMGLQATSNKRKYEMGVCEEVEDVQSNCSPPKSIKWSTSLTTNITTSNIITANKTICSENSIAKLEAVVVPGWGAEPIVDSIQRLQAVTVPGETWGSDSTRSTLATTLLPPDDIDDYDDEFDDDFEEEETAIPTFPILRYPYHRGCIPPGYHKTLGYYATEPFPQQNCARTPGSYPRPGPYGWNNSGYYTHPEAASPQQTIRCAENGKSYLELGSASYGPSIGARHAKKCCDGRNNWCNTKQCYKDRRLKMMNLSMFKLSRFRQVSEQSLYRSVLICNTLKSIEKEIDVEKKDTTDYSEHQFSSNRLTNNENSIKNQHHLINRNSTNKQLFINKPVTLTTQNTQFEHNLNTPFENPLKNTQNGRVTPFPAISNIQDTDSGYGDEEFSRQFTSINWGSVLSLSALDPVNSNDIFSTTVTSSIATPTLNWDYGQLDMDLGLGAELTELLPSWKLAPLSADDIVKSVNPPMEPSKVVNDSEIDLFTHIMVGS